MITRIEEHTLGRQTYLGKGKTGRVFTLEDYSVAGISGKIAYKKFYEEYRVNSLDPARLGKIVDFRRNLTLKERHLIDHFSAWPLAEVVNSDDEVCGLLMPQAGEEFFFEKVLDWAPDNGERKPIAAERLMTPVSVSREISAPCPDRNDVTTRMTLLAGMCALFAILHKYDITYGDISGNNCLYSLDPSPRILLIDCDAAAPKGFRAEGHTPGFTPPEVSSSLVKEQNECTDRYKIGLFIYRSLMSELPGGEGMTRVKDPRQVARLLAGILDSQGIAMLESTVSADPLDRTYSSMDWYRYLYHQVQIRTRPPVILSTALDHSFVVAGETVNLSIVFQGADSVRIIHPDGRSQDAALLSSTITFSFTALESGSIQIIAVNGFGECRVRSPSLRILSITSPERVPFPTPIIPALDREDLYVLRTGIDSSPYSRSGDEVVGLAKRALSEVGDGRLGVSEILDLGRGAEILSKKILSPVNVPILTRDDLILASTDARDAVERPSIYRVVQRWLGAFDKETS
ncbi:hypothetical protein [Glutamicibacter ardleyensis]|uniref:hypothetical protein n=1 Tax=Glutamicibacter ardleyensis TaxID=225894 RepID=UPI003FD01739